MSATADRITRLRALRDELLRRRDERDFGPVLLFEFFEPCVDGSHPPHIPAPESLRGRRITRVCLPPSPHYPALALGLYRSDPRGLVWLASPEVSQ